MLGRTIPGPTNRVLIEHRQAQAFTVMVCLFTTAEELQKWLSL